jgi:hypothetical protein
MFCFMAHVVVASSPLCTVVTPQRPILQHPHPTDSMSLPKAQGHPQSQGLQGPPPIQVGSTQSINPPGWFYAAFIDFFKGVDSRHCPPFECLCLFPQPCLTGWSSTLHCWGEALIPQAFCETHDAPPLHQQSGNLGPTARGCSPAPSMDPPPPKTILVLWVGLVFPSLPSVALATQLGLVVLSLPPVRRFGGSYSASAGSGAPYPFVGSSSGGLPVTPFGFSWGPQSQPASHSLYAGGYMRPPIEPEACLADNVAPSHLHHSWAPPTTVSLQALSVSGSLSTC